MTESLKGHSTPLEHLKTFRINRKHIPTLDVGFHYMKAHWMSSHLFMLTDGFKMSDDELIAFLDGEESYNLEIYEDPEIEEDLSWDFHHDYDNKSYAQAYENKKLKKQLELAVECIAELRNLGFHNEVVKVVADLATKEIKTLEDAPVNMSRMDGYGWKG